MAAWGEITDVELGLSIGFQKDLEAVAAQSQAVVNRIAAERDAALREVAHLRKQLAAVKGELEVARFQARRRALHA